MSFGTRVGAGFVGQAEEIIDTRLVKVSQTRQQLIRPLLLPSFQITVFPLCDADCLSDMRLCKIVVCTKVFDSNFHLNHPTIE